MSASSPDAARRVVALVLPEFLLEVAQAASPDKVRGAWGIVLVEPDDPALQSGEPLKPTARLDAVSAEARRCGVREGQTIAEARALVAGFEVDRLFSNAVERALSVLAEVALGFGATVSLRVPDTVWVDVSGSAHLFGGEEALAEELLERVRALGHATRAAVAPGPELARAVARWAPPRRDGKNVHVVPVEGARQAVEELPVVALPLSSDCQNFLVRLGVLTLKDLAALPRSTLSSRLDGEVTRALDLSVGIDPTPLVPYELPENVVEELGFEHGVEGSEPLLFALRGLAARFAARLAGRGMAVEKVELELLHDRTIARLRGARESTLLKFSLSTPLTREEEIRRVLSSRLERTRLPAPTVGVRLAAKVLVSAVARQLELGQALSGGTDVEKELPLVVAEIAADVGEGRVGVLEILDAHRIEARSMLAPALKEEPRTRSSKSRANARRGGSRASAPRGPGPRWATPLSVHVSGASLAVVEGASSLDERAPLTRLLPEPVRLDSPLRIGATIAVERSLYTIEALRFEHRLHAVEWWNGAPVTRDYVRVWLKSLENVIEALVYVDRTNGRRYLQAVAD